MPPSTANVNSPSTASEDLISRMPLLQSVMEALERETGLHMSFDDFTGAMNGMHLDVPAMHLDWNHQVHACSFCSLAHSTSVGDRDCVLNKLATNRLVGRRRVGMEGFCHLGLFDMIEPLIFQERVLGAFYYGSVLVRGREDFTRQKIARYCARRGMDSEVYERALSGVTVIEAAAIPGHRETLRTVAKLARFFCEAAGVQAEVYRYRALRFPYQDPEELPYVVKETMHYITSHIDEPFIVKDLAAHLRCHPDFLSRKFKRHTGVDLSLYLQQARVDRAKRLLENPKMDIGMVAEQSGFSDRVHFSKVFRRVTGVTPGQFQRQAAK
jgi:AraC-like DNA-binding protein